MEQLDLFSIQVADIVDVNDITATATVDEQAEATANASVPVASLSADNSTAAHADISAPALPAMIETSDTSAIAAKPIVVAAREQVNAPTAAPAADPPNTAGSAIAPAPIQSQPPAPGLTAPALVRSFADLLPHIRSWTDLPPRRRKAMERGVIACCEVLGHNLGMGHAPLTAFRVDVA